MSEKLLRKSFIIPCSFLLLMLAAFFSEGYYQADEHYQLLEFAGLKLHLNQAENLPWEYHEKMRATIQPIIAIIIYRISSCFSITSPFIVVLFLRIMSACLAFYSMFKFHQYMSLKIYNEKLKHWFTLLSFLTWFLIFNSVRFSSENWSGAIFFIALVIYLQTDKNDFLKYVWIGCLFGFSFLFRFQSIFLIFGLFAWSILIQKIRIKIVFYVSAGFVLIFLFGILLDSLFYESFTISSWNYFWKFFNHNIVQNHVSFFGESPWNFYFTEAYKIGIAPFSLVYIVAILCYVFWKPKDVLTWCLVSFLGIHFFIAHKELRFFFPILMVLPFLFIESIRLVDEKYQIDLTKIKLFNWFVVLYLVFNISFSLVQAIRPLNPNFDLYKTIYFSFKTPTKLYYLEKNPYEGIHFYRHTNLQVLQVTDYACLKNVDKREKGNVLLAVKTGDRIPTFLKKKQILCTSSDSFIWNITFFRQLVSPMDTYSVYVLKREN